MKRVRKVIELLGVNWQTLAGFEFLYKVMSTAFQICFPFIKIITLPSK